MSGCLYVVATPIGNLEDMTYRAVRILSEVDLIAAEDTRHARILLERYGIRTPLSSCHKYNEAGKLDYFLDKLSTGMHVALISDAGTPCIADPGHRLVARAAAAGVNVVPVCGANAAATAISVSGFEASPFVFIGFLPRARADVLHALRVLEQPAHPCTVFYESPKRIEHTLRWMDEAYPTAALCLCNDLTKQFERIYRGAPSEVLSELQDNPHAGKGEYTGVVKLAQRNNEPSETQEEDENGISATEARLVDMMIRNDVSLKGAVQMLHETEKEKLTKKEIYAASLRLKALFDV